MKYIPPLYGSGKGGGGKARLPQEDEDTLQSKAWVRLIDLLGEGQMDGFATESGILIEDCTLVTPPVLLADGSLAYPVEDFPRDAEANITTAITANSSGYLVSGPNGDKSLPGRIVCTVDGEVVEGQTLVPAVIVAMVWPLNQFPQGRIRGLRIENPGLNYASFTLVIPPATGTAIFFDDIPLVDPRTFVMNFREVRLEYRLGLDSQTVMPGFDQIEETLEEARFPIIKDDPFTFEFSGNYDYVIVDIGLRQGFYRQHATNGDIKEVQGIQFKMEVQYRSASDASYSSLRGLGSGTFVIGGKTMSEYVRSYKLKLPRKEDSTFHSWLITVSRISNDDEQLDDIDKDYRHFTKLGVNSITLITDVKLSYPHSALVGIEVNAQQFSRIPNRRYNMRMLQVEVPSNYFPPGTVNGTVIRQFGEYNRLPDGTPSVNANGEPIPVLWDGTFYMSWTNNPAWIFYAVCTHWRYGLGDFLSGVDKWGIYKIGRYCDELVPTGWADGAYTTNEARFSCNVYIQTREEAWKVLSDLASVFRGMLYWAAGTIMPIQDAPKPLRRIFTPSNVVDGLFTYSSTEKRSRYTVAIVRYTDPQDHFKQKPIVVENPKAIVRYGWQPLEVPAFGCTSKGQARRMGNNLLLSSEANTEIVTFRAGLEESILRPGDRIAIQDPVRAQVVFGGRIIDIASDPDDGHGIIITDTAVPLDKISLSEPSQYRLILSRPTPLPDNSVITNEAELRDHISQQVTNESEGAIRSFSYDSFNRLIVNLTGGLPPRVPVGGVWLLKHMLVHPKDFVIVNIKEAARNLFDLTCAEYNEGIYPATDLEIPFEEVPINIDPNAWKRPGVPRNLRLQENPRDDTSGRFWRITFSWSAPTFGFVSEYQVYYSRGEANFQLVTATPNTSADIDIRTADNYCFRVYAVGITGIRSVPVTLCRVIGSITAENEELVSGLEIRDQGNITEFLTSSVIFDWRVNWSGADSSLHADVFPVLPPGVKEYRVRFLNVDAVYDAEDLLVYNVGSTLREWRPIESEFLLTLDENLSLPYGPYREFILEVAVIDDNGGASIPRQIRVNNPRPAALSYITITNDEATGQLLVRLLDFVQPVDFKSIVVFRSEITGFTPAIDDITGHFFSNTFSLVGDIGTVYYFRIGILDQLAKNDLDCLLSDELTGTPTQISPLSIFDYQR